MSASSPIIVHPDTIRAFLRNPAKYPAPDNFRPERWLDPGWPTYQAPLTQFPTIKGMTSFGWGQRQCLGMSVTQDELLIACGALAWCFNLKPKINPATGVPFPVPTDKSNSLLIIKPDPFQMDFEPRSLARRREALQAWEKAEAAERQARVDFVERARRGCSGVNVDQKKPCSVVPGRLMMSLDEKAIMQVSWTQTRVERP